MKFELEPSQENNVLNDILSFSWIPLMKSSDPSEYKDMGVLGSVNQFVVLIVFNSIILLVGLKVLFGDNPYIDFSRDLGHVPFNIIIVFLTIVTYLSSLIVQFLSFRIVSGKGNLLAQGYLSALATTNYILLFLLAVGLLLLIRVRGVENVSLLILRIGSIYMIVPSFISLKGLHRISNVRTFVGLVLSIIFSSPVLILYYLLLNYFGESHPFQIYHWTTMFILSTLLFICIFILAYILWQQELEPEYSECVPIRKPVEEMLKIRWIKIPLGVTLSFSVLFFLIEIAPINLPTDMFPAEASLITPIIFIVSLIFVFVVWERKLFVIRHENITLKRLWFKYRDQ